MTKFVRLAALAAATLAATPAAAQVAASPKATATARITKPLTLTAEESLDFGAGIIVTGDSTVSIDTLGVGTCGAAVDVICDFTGAQAARFRVTGSNQQQVTIAATGSSLGRVGGGGSIAFTPTLLSNTVTLPNSGATGTTFNVGGSIALLASTPAGTYTGDIEVTVQY